ncbi:hypothetical protein FHR50_002912 [Xanthomonas arboricola]
MLAPGTPTIVTGLARSPSRDPWRPAIGEDTASRTWLVVLLKNEDAASPACRLLIETCAHRPSPPVLARPPSRDPWRHGCRHGATWTYLQRVPRWWAGKGPAATAQMIRCSPDLPVASNQIATPASCVSRALGCLRVWSRARCPHRSRDTPRVRPCRLGGGIHAATRSRNRRGHHARQLAGGFVEKLCRKAKTSRRSLLVAVEIHSGRPTRLVLARPPSRDPWRHGCRHGATWMYLQRVPRWWAGKGPAANSQIIRSANLLQPARRGCSTTSDNLLSQAITQAACLHASRRRQFGRHHPKQNSDACFHASLPGLPLSRDPIRNRSSTSPGQSAVPGRPPPDSIAD